MRLLTKAEACRELRLSLSTLNRRIAAGEVPVKREPRGRRHRVYLMLDDDLSSAIEAPLSELAIAQEQVRGLEEQVAFLQEQLDLERQRNAESIDALKAEAQAATGPQKRSGSWRLWNRHSRKAQVTHTRHFRQSGE